MSEATITGTQAPKWISETMKANKREDAQGSQKKGGVFAVRAETVVKKFARIPNKNEMDTINVVLENRKNAFCVAGWDKLSAAPQYTDAQDMIVIISKLNMVEKIVSGVR